MYQAAPAIWNEIAETQKVKADPWKRLFRQPADRMLAELNAMESRLEAVGASARVVRAYLLTAPLLTENLAISTYLAERQSVTLREALPELTTIREAVDLATAEFRLTAREQTHLRTLLQRAISGSEPSSAPLPA